LLSVLPGGHFGVAEGGGALLVVVGLGALTVGLLIAGVVGALTVGLLILGVVGVFSVGEALVCAFTCDAIAIRASPSAIPRHMMLLRMLSPVAGEFSSSTYVESTRVSVDDVLQHLLAETDAHARCAVFQIAEVAVPRDLVEKILRPIDGLRRRPAPA